MDGKLIDFLVSSGGAGLDEVIARVPSRPHKLIEALQEMQQKGFIQVVGPKTVGDLDELVTAVRRANGYDAGSKDYQRRAVLREIFSKSVEFSKTNVRLSTPGYAFALN